MDVDVSYNINPTKIDIETGNCLETGQVFYKDTNNHIRFIQTFDNEIAKRLIELGWTPPEGHPMRDYKPDRNRL